MQDDAGKDPKSTEKELWRVCSTLWTENVRQDLVYSSKLSFCKACVSFFYSQAHNDHPGEHVLMVHEYFMANDITSLSKMVDFFRPASKMTTVVESGLSLPTLPVMSTIHRMVNTKGFSQESSQSFDRVALLCRDTTKQMMEVVDQQNKTICDLRCEVEELRNQNEELLLKMVKSKAKASFNKRALARLANHMLLYCEECQCENDQCDHPTTDSYTENKAK